MNTFQSLQPKNHSTSLPAMPSYPSLRTTRSLTSPPAAALEQVPPVSLEQLNQRAPFGHALAHIAILPPASQPISEQQTDSVPAMVPERQFLPLPASLPSVQPSSAPLSNEELVRVGHPLRFGHSFANLPLFPAVQRKPILPFPLQREQQLQPRIQAARGKGHPFDKQTQQYLEQGLDVDLSGVQVHTDSEANDLTRSVNAVAFTTGADIFFRAGTYNPGTREGLHLLAHEATHVVQQATGSVAGKPYGGNISLSDPHDQFERAAEESAVRIMARKASHFGSPDQSNRQSKSDEQEVRSVRAPGVKQQRRGAEQPMLALQRYVLTPVHYESVEAGIARGERDQYYINTNGQELSTNVNIATLTYTNTAGMARPPDTRQSAGVQQHSEKLLIGGAIVREGGPQPSVPLTLAQAALFQGLHQAGTAALYTERKPCPGCSAILNAALFPNDTVYYTVENDENASDDLKMLRRAWRDFQRLKGVFPF